MYKHPDVFSSGSLHSNMADNTDTDIQANSSVSDYFKDPHQWTYRCEGSWTIVVSLNKLKTVLRLRKHEKKNSLKLKDERKYEQEMLRNLDFAKSVMLPLMGGHYVHLGKAISVPEDFPLAMNEICRGSRPEHRLNKEIDEGCHAGVLMPDLCFLPSLPQAVSTEENYIYSMKTMNPTFSVEIKPKCGFLPTSPFIDPTRAIKYSVCSYCMLQRTKVKEGKHNRESSYCPLDLFSGEPRRVMYALECLVCDPQNNFRVFRDGSGMFSEELAQKAIQNGRACCSQNYFEITLQEMKVFTEWVTAPSHKCGDGVTTEFQKSEDMDGVTTEGQKEDGVTKESDIHGDDTTREDHKCCFVGPFTHKFLEILLRILISDSKSNQIHQNKVSMSSTATMCKKSKYLDCNNGIQSQLNYLQFGKGGVLQQLLSVQKLDDNDVEGIHPLYKNVISHFECNPGLRNSLGVDGPYTLPLWKTVASSLETNNSKPPDNIQMLNADLNDPNNLYDAVVKTCKFAVASTAKDCSLMLAFQKTLKKETRLPTVEMACGDMYHYNIDLVDLDPKEFDRVGKYYKDTVKTVEIFLEQ